jgi:DNA primase
LPREFADPDLKDNPELAKRRAEEREKLATALKLNRFAAKFYRDQLLDIPAARTYFEKRGISDPLSDSGIARNFYLGASQSGWDSLARRLTQAKAPLPLAHEGDQVATLAAAKAMKHLLRLRH